MMALSCFGEPDVSLSPAILGGSCLFFPASRQGRNHELAQGTTGVAELSIKSHQGTIEPLSQRHAQGVVAGQVAPQHPYPLGERRERKQFKVEPQQVPVGSGNLLVEAAPSNGRGCRSSGRASAMRAETYGSE